MLKVEPTGATPTGADLAQLLAERDVTRIMTYRQVPGFLDMLYGIRIPRRDGAARRHRILEYAPGL
jgi:hypothetical protein